MSDGPIRIEPIWIDAPIASAIYDRQLSEHGGPNGVRDNGALESAPQNILARAQNKWEYGEDDLAVLAAAYAFGVARNYPFADGHKRTAWVLARSFLALNAAQLRFDPLDALRTVQALAAGDLSEEELADWFRQHIA